MNFTYLSEIKLIFHLFQNGGDYIASRRKRSRTGYFTNRINIRSESRSDKINSLCLSLSLSHLAPSSWWWLRRLHQPRCRHPRSRRSLPPRLAARGWSRHANSTDFQRRSSAQGRHFLPPLSLFLSLSSTLANERSCGRKKRNIFLSSRYNSFYTFKLTDKLMEEKLEKFFFHIILLYITNLVNINLYLYFYK